MDDINSVVWAVHRVNDGMDRKKYLTNSSDAI